MFRTHGGIRAQLQRLAAAAAAGDGIIRLCVHTHVCIHTHTYTHARFGARPLGLANLNKFFSKGHVWVEAIPTLPSKPSSSVESSVVNIGAELCRKRGGGTER